MSEPSEPANTIQMEIVNIDNAHQMDKVKEIVREYFNWGNSLSIAKHGFNFDISQMFKEFLDDLTSYKQPRGILYLLRVGELPVGTGGFKRVNDRACELKRMYIREKYRKTGLGRKLLKQLIADAGSFGYTEMQLESARFMIDAFRLYKRFGFQEIPIYSDVETPTEFQSIIYCMKLAL